MKRILLLLIFFPQLLLAVQPEKWTAQWIMHPTVQPQAHAVVLFRKNFELTKKPDSFVVHVSADNHYRLFVNGQYILRGPARGDLSHWFYETVDIAKYLQSGENEIGRASCRERV